MVQDDVDILLEKSRLVPATESLILTVVIAFRFDAVGMAPVAESPSPVTVDQVFVPRSRGQIAWLTYLSRRTASGSIDPERYSVSVW